MKPQDILLVGVKYSVLAFESSTGRRLWATPLSHGMSDSFVSLVADEERVYAHAGGKVYCLELYSGKELWHDDLSGYGYQVACLAVAGTKPSGVAAAHIVKQQGDSESAAAMNSLHQIAQQADAANSHSAPQF